MALDLSESVGYHYGKFPPTNLNYQKLMSPLTEAVGAISRYDQMLKSLHNGELLLAPLRKQEAVISSRIEGTISTIDEVYQYEADHPDGINHNNGPRDDLLETLLYQYSMRSAQAQLENGRPLGAWMIRAMHGELLSMGRGANKKPGEFKSEQNYLADQSKKKILFTPISPDKLTDGLEALFSYIESSEEQPLIKIALSHVEFEALHPFEDGNGRVGRMLITLLLWNMGLLSSPNFFLSGYFDENKGEYIDRLRSVSDADDWTGWCIFFFQAIKEQSIKNLEICEKISNLYEEMKEIFRETLSSQWHLTALDYIFTNPVFRNNRFKHDSGIPPQTANRFTNTLAERGYLKTIHEASGRSAALYAFEPLLEIIRV